MTIQSFSSSMNAMTSSQVITGWTAVAQEPLSAEIRPTVEQVTVQLGQVLQKHNCLLTARLFQNPADRQALLAGHRALESFMRLYGTGDETFEPLIDGLATAIKAEVGKLSLVQAEEQATAEIPDEALIDKYEQALRLFIRKKGTGRTERFVAEQDGREVRLPSTGPIAIRAAIQAIHRQIDTASLEDTRLMLMFLGLIAPDGRSGAMGFDCLVSPLHRPLPQEIKVEFVELRLRIVKKLLQHQDEVTYKYPTPFRFLYENSAITRFERKPIYRSPTQEIDDAYNEQAKPVMIANLEENVKWLEAELAKIKKR